VFHVRYELYFYIPEDDILHSHRRETSNLAMKDVVLWDIKPCGCSKNNRRHVPEDNILHDRGLSTDFVRPPGGFGGRPGSKKFRTKRRSGIRRKPQKQRRP
jgi:hypothetical protein